MRFWSLIVYAQKPPIYVHTGVSSGTRGLNFSLSLHLHIHQYFACAFPEGGGGAGGLGPPGKSQK